MPKEMKHEDMLIVKRQREQTTEIGANAALGRRTALFALISNLAGRRRGAIEELRAKFAFDLIS